MVTTVLVWLLLTTPERSNGGGQLSVVERFATLQQCEFVQNNAPVGYHSTKCVKAQILIVK